jgi:WD40 repeat protein
VLASAGEDGTLRLWDLKRGGRAVRSYQSHTGAIQAIGYAPDGRTIAAAGADGTVRMWDATLPKPGT